MSLIGMSKAYDRMRYALAKSESELEELRMMLHQFTETKDPAAMETARVYLLAVVRERQALLDALAKDREMGRA